MVHLTDLLSPDGPEGQETLRVSLADRLRAVTSARAAPAKPAPAKTASAASRPQKFSPVRPHFQPNPATDLFPLYVEQYSVVTDLFPEKGYGVIEQFQGGERAHFDLRRNPKIEIGMVVRYARYVDESRTIWAEQLRPVNVDVYRRHAQVESYTPLITRGFLADPFLSQQIPFSAQPEMKAQFPAGSWVQFWLVERSLTPYALDLKPGNARDASLYTASVVAVSTTSPVHLLGNLDEPIRLEQHVLEAAGKQSLSVGESVTFRMERRPTENANYAWQLLP